VLEKAKNILEFSVKNCVRNTKKFACDKNRVYQCNLSGVLTRKICPKNVYETVIQCVVDFIHKHAKLIINISPNINHFTSILFITFCNTLSDDLNFITN
jgi:hypothetical protein